MSDNKVKAPSQVFKWFEKMKENYDKNILAIIQRFEQSNSQQQSRLDAAHSKHINILQENHVNQISQLNSQIDKKEQEIAYFKQQLASQQQTIVQLTNKYDNVIFELVTSSKNSSNYKEVFNDDIINIESNVSDIADKNVKSDDIVLDTLINDTGSLSSSYDDEIERLYQQALAMREHNDKAQAFLVFKKAATFGHVQAMGALGRAYFLAEGVEEAPVLGLAWLINAANLGLPQAIKRVEHFKLNEEKLYQEAILLAQEVASECLAALV